MILAADAGNTNITLGLYDQDQLVTTARLPTKPAKTRDEFVQDILNILLEARVPVGAIEGIVVSTVAGEATSAFLDGARKLFHTEPLVVTNQSKTGIVIKTDVPSQLGSDRLVNAAAAFHEYVGPLLVIDFGTATTYDVITEKGEFLGGVIAPGIGICAEALWEKTAQLPKITIEKPDSVMGTNTVSSMKSGVYYGYLGQLEYFVRRLKEEQERDFKVIATGGLSGIFRGCTDVIDVFDPDLTLKGLNVIYAINNRLQYHDAI